MNQVMNEYKKFLKRIYLGEPSYTAIAMIHLRPGGSYDATR